MNKGIFITFEGTDACGKSTQLALLKEYFGKTSHPVVFVREPGGTVLGEKIRSLLLTDEEVNMCGKAELMLFMASRAELYEKTIKPALSQGKIVVADRYYDSTIAYQGSARGVLDKDEILNMNRNLLDGLTPDLTIYLKISPKDSWKRKGNEKLDKIEKEGLAFQEKVAEGYEYIISKEPDRFLIVDATKTREEIHNEITAAIEKLINSKS